MMDIKRKVWHRHGDGQRGIQRQLVDPMFWIFPRINPRRLFLPRNTYTIVPFYRHIFHET